LEWKIFWFKISKTVEIPTPKPGTRDILVKVFATSVNPLDYRRYKNELTLPVITGHDVSGVIVEVGHGVENFKIGDEVYKLKIILMLSCN
jgi:NADPH:quinone reductase